LHKTVFVHKLGVDVDELIRAVVRALPSREPVTVIRKLVREPGNFAPSFRCQARIQKGI